MSVHLSCAFTPRHLEKFSSGDMIHGGVEKTVIINHLPPLSSTSTSSTIMKGASNTTFDGDGVELLLRVVLHPFLRVFFVTTGSFLTSEWIVRTNSERKKP